MRRIPAVVITAALAVVAALPVSSAAQAAPAAPAAGARTDAALLLEGLPVRSESHAASYERDRFGGWNDRDRDGEDTRAEVLQAESRITASVSASGTVKGGRWISAYDNVVISKATRLDVDHLVPLAEAWRSGAWDWSARKREAFANDLGFGPSLIAVSASSNRAKSDADPAGWLPPATAFHCGYVKQYVAVKARWKLSVDAGEKAAIEDVLAGCSSMMVAKPAAPKVAALVAAKPTPVAKPSGGGSAYYRNCDAVRAAGAAPLYRGQPGYETPRLDRDGDGVACE